MDYRTRNIVNIDLNKNNQIYKDDDITKIVKKNYHNIDYKKRFIVNSRSIAVKLFQVIFYGFHFKDFFKKPIGNSEYIKISKNEWIFVDFVKCNVSSIDIIRRFYIFY